MYGGKFESDEDFIIWETMIASIFLYLAGFAETRYLEGGQSGSSYQVYQEEVVATCRENIFIGLGTFCQGELIAMQERSKSRKVCYLIALAWSLAEGFFTTPKICHISYSG